MVSTIKFERECCFQELNSGYVHRGFFHTQVWLRLRRLKLFVPLRCKTKSNCTAEERRAQRNRQSKLTAQLLKSRFGLAIQFPNEFY